MDFRSNVVKVIDLRCVAASLGNWFPKSREIYWSHLHVSKRPGQLPCDSAPHPRGTGASTYIIIC